MALVLADRVRDTTTTTGTGTVTLSGTAPTGYQTFGATIGNGNTTYYTINAGSQWEVGIGTYSSTGPTLARTTVLASSNSGSLVDFSTGTKDVFVTYPAEEAVYQDGSTIKAGTAILGVTNGGTGTNTAFTSGSVVFAGASGVYSQDNANLFWDNTNDRLGIGTSSPGAALQINKASGAADLRLSVAGTLYSNIYASSSDANIFSITAIPLILGTNSVERMRIDSSGNVGIGTSSPAYKLTVSGDIGGASSLFLGANLNNANSVEIGNGRTGNNFAYIDLIGDTTYTDYGTRLLRGNSGANSQSILAHRGTGELVIRTEDAAVISFATTNTERMRIDSSGNVGIGTSSPTSRLTITGGTTEIRDGNYLMLRPSGNGWDMRLQATSTQLDILSGGALGSPIMSLVNGGNVGIGTSSPGSKLDVVAQDAIRATGFQPFLTLRDSSDANKGSRIQTASATTIFYNDTTGGGTYTERMRITSAGNVGIGTSSPNYKLETNGIIASYVPGVGQAGYWLYNGGATAEWFTGQRSGTDHAYKISTVVAGTYTDRVTVDTSGNVGIGTSSPGKKLDLVGQFRVSGSAASGYALLEYGTSATATNNWHVGSEGDGSFRWYNGTFGAGTERMRITSGGFLLVGTTAPLGGNTSSEFKVTGAGSWPLTLNANDRGLLVRNSAAGSGFYAYFEYNGGTNNGSISWSGGTTSYTTTSDARIKKNIVDAPDAGALIDAIQVRSWDFKADDVHWRYGMVAQELLPVAPEAVTVPEDEEIMMGVDYAKLVPMLIKEVQSLRARVAQLEGN